MSMPCSRAACTSASKSSMVPSSGWIASWPPASSPIAHGLPGSSGPATSVLLRPFRCVWTIGGSGGAVRGAQAGAGGQVEAVEAELLQARELLLHAADAAERAGEELVPGAEAGELAVD